MRAAVMQEWRLSVQEVADPVPKAGQVLAKVLACGICGSDLHMLRHGAEQFRLAAEVRADAPPDPLQPAIFSPDQPTIMGHEFCCEVVELGPGCDNLRVGDVVTSMPVAFDETGLHGIGYSNQYAGGYAELMVLNELLAIKVPSGLGPEIAALTEPFAVGVHAVAKSRISSGESAIVLGLGPVGLAVVAELKRRGIGPIIAADFSQKRRQLGEAMGADVIVDPRETTAIDAWRRIDGVQQLVIFEAVGVPGMIDQAMRMAPKNARILVVGACMQADSFHPMLGITKELNIQFVFGYEPGEFSASLEAIADGRVDLAPWLTGAVAIDGVPQAFIDLANPEQHAKILVVP